VTGELHSADPGAGSIRPRAYEMSAKSRRVLALLVVSWVCSAGLLSGIGRPVLTAAGLLLGLLLPGWLAAETVLTRRTAALELWLAVSLGVSLGVTLVLGALGATFGDLSRSVLGWGWLLVTSLLGAAALLSHERVAGTDATS
jgi:hypothetical protein